MKQLGFLEFILEMVISNQLIGVERRVFSLIFEFFLKPTKFKGLDKTNLQNFINFSFNPFMKFHSEETSTPKFKNLKRIQSCQNINVSVVENIKLIERSPFVDKYEKLEKADKVDKNEKLEKNENFLFLENFRLLQTPIRKSCEKIPLYDENHFKKTQKFFDFIIGPEKCELHKRCFLLTFCQVFSLNEPEFYDMLNYKLVLQFLIMDSKVEDISISSKRTHNLLLKCFYLSLQRKEDFNNFLEDGDIRLALIPYCVMERLYYYCFCLIVKNNLAVKPDENLPIFEVFNHKITKNSLDEQEIHMAILTMDISNHAFEIIKIFISFMNKDDNIKSFKSFIGNNKHRRSQSLGKDDCLIEELRNFRMLDDLKLMKKQIFSAFLENENSTLKEKLLEFYNKIISKNCLVDDIHEFPDFFFLLRVYSLLVKLFLKQKYLKNKWLCSALIDIVLRNEVFLKEINESLPKKLSPNPEVQELLGLAIAQIGLLNESFDITNIEKSEAFTKLNRIETQIKKIFSEKTFYEVIDISLTILEEICEENENNFNEVSKALAFSFNLLFKFLLKTNNFILYKRCSGFLINLLKKYYYGEKIENSAKKTGLLSNFLNKLGINDQNSKKLNIKQNKFFFNEIQSLLKKSLLFLLRLFENKTVVFLNNEEMILETLGYIEDNETMIMDHSTEFMDFLHCVVYLLTTKFLEM